MGGVFSNYNGTPAARVARLNADGSLDMSFSLSGTGFTGDVYDIALQDDGKVIVAGLISAYNGTPPPRIARLNSEGSLDTSFAPTGTRFNSWVNSVSVLSNGKIFAGGNFTSYNSVSTPYVARLNADGTLDSNFSLPDLGLDGEVLKVLVCV